MAITTNTMGVSGSVVNHSSGHLVNDAGGAVAVVLSIGFVPRIFRIHNVTDRISYEWYNGMTNPGAVKTIAAGTRSLETTEGPTIGSAAAGTEGQVSVPASIILASKTFVWEAVA